MFGKKKEKGVAVAGDYHNKIEQKIVHYKAIRQFEKDVKQMAKQGWYVKAQTNKHDTGIGFVLGVKHDVIIVTYERIVRG
jgi:hypothetical protein